MNRFAVIVGSLRKESFTRKLVKAMAGVAPADLKLEIVEIGDLPHFSQDDEANPVAAVVRFRDLAMSGLLLCCVWNG